MNTRSHHWRWLAAAAALLLIAADAPDREQKSTADAATETATAARAESQVAYVVRVPLPLRGSADSQVKRQIEQAVSASDSPESRTTIVLEFVSDNEETGEGSEYERALSLARYLAGRSLTGVRTIAFIPKSLQGHAVLPALACEELIMARDAELGAAGIGETEIDASMIAAYEDIAKRRRLVPPPVVLAMLDPQRELLRVETLDGVKYVDRAGLAKLKEKAAVGDVKTMVQSGDLGKLRGELLRVDFGAVSRLAKDRKELASALRLPTSGLRDAMLAGTDWRAIRVNLHGRMNSRVVSEAMQAVEQQLQTESANLLCVHINSPGGSPSSSIELANYLASFSGGDLRTVAFVDREARGDAVIAALSCDDLIVSDEAILGGPGDAAFSENERYDLKDPLKTIAKRRSRDWSLMLGLVDSQTPVYRYTRDGGGQIRYLTDEEWEGLATRDQWTRGSQLELSKGISAAEAIEYDLAKQTLGDFAELARLYNVEEFEMVKRSRVVTAIENFAAQRWLARMLLFIAFFALISEASAPGLGVPGFISAVCFLLFFWMQFLNGTAGWLEIVLFVGGLTFIAIEVLVIPGFGVFGGGGLLMVLSSIILATQTFILPRNSYQYEQLPKSLFTVVAGMAGTLVALIVMRQVFPHTPFARHMMLLPPDDEELDARERREQLADYAHLSGKQGVAATPLRPSGKAMIGDDLVDVISSEMVSQGEVIRVVEVRGHRVLVEAVGSHA